MTDRIHAYLDRHKPATPCLVVDLEEIEQTYRHLKTCLPETDIYYAVKANPAPDIIARLVRLGCCFDTASIPEIEICLAAGANPETISYGNTIKKAADIAHAYAAGIRLFAFDSREELEKLCHHAPGARVLCRILLTNRVAGWPITDKFGCSADMAIDLIHQAKEYGMKPLGLSFHVGSQQVNLHQWDRALKTTARLFTRLQASGLDMSLINIGGGLPVPYCTATPGIEEYANHLHQAIHKYFPAQTPKIILEPGRFLVATAGVIESQIITVTQKSTGDQHRWIYLDIGTNGGLIEAINHNIQYPIQALGPDRRCGPVAVAGPTCDWADIIRRDGVELPLDLRAGDRLRLLKTGAYTASCATIGFNGFAPLKIHCI